MRYKNHGNYLFFFTFLNFIFLTLNAVSLKLEVDTPEQNKAYSGQPFDMHVTVSDLDRDGSSDVTVEGIDQAKILSRRTHTNMSIINGAVSSSNTYTYTLFFEKIGRYTLGPAQVTVKGSQITSNTLTLDVIQAPDKPKQQSVPDEKTDMSKNFFAKLTSETKDYYLGQPITVFLKIYANKSVHDVHIGNLICKGATVQEDQEMKRGKERIDNDEYVVFIKKYMLSSFDPGPLQIMPLEVVFGVPSQRRTQRLSPFDSLFGDMFAQTQVIQYRTHTNKLDINLLAPPQSDKAYSGIGSFSQFSLHVDRTSVKQNEPITLTLSIQGSNLERVKTPKLILPDYIKSYESKNYIKDARKIFEYLIQVDKSGEVSIPTQEFTYFDCAQKNYKTLTTEPITLSVVPSHEKALIPASQQNQTTDQSPRSIQEHQDGQEKADDNGQDINFIEEDNTQKTRDYPAIPLWLFVLLLIVPLVFLTDVLACVNNVIRARLFSSYQFQRKLFLCKGKFDVLEQKKQAHRLYQFFLSLLATKYNVLPEVVTHDWIFDQLLRDNWSEQKVHEFLEFINECARVHFMTHTHDQDAVHLFKKGSYWLVIITNIKT